MRAGERWSLLQSMKNHFLYHGLRLALAIADRIPSSTLPLAGRLAGWMAYYVGRQQRARALAQLRLGLPDHDPTHLLKVCYCTAGENLGLSLLLRRPWFRALDCVKADGHCRAVLDAAIRVGRGVVFVTPHFGPFELLAAAIVELGYRPAVVVRESYDPRLDPLVDAHRTTRGITVIHRGASGAAMTILRCLKAGRPVGFLPDLAGRTQRISVPLLKGWATIARGPASIAQRTGSPVVTGVLVPLRHRSSGHRTPSEGMFALRLTLIPPAVNEEQLSQRVAEVFTAAISRSPEQWLWMGAAFQDDAARPTG